MNTALVGGIIAVIAVVAAGLGGWWVGVNQAQQVLPSPTLTPFLTLPTSTPVFPAGPTVLPSPTPTFTLSQ